MPPWVGIARPPTFIRATAGVIGTSSSAAARTIAWTCSALVGFRTRSARPATFSVMSSA